MQMSGTEGHCGDEREPNHEMTSPEPRDERVRSPWR